MDAKEKALQMHEQWGGKIEVIARCPVSSREELSVAYTPGVAEPCLKIKDNVDLSYTYTRRHNLVAVITDGTAMDNCSKYGFEKATGEITYFDAYLDFCHRYMYVFRLRIVVFEKRR